MNEKNLSPWFLLSEQTPWEVGVYEVRDSWGSRWMCRWDGEKFLAQARNVETANLQTHPPTICILHWRGLSTDPEVKKNPVNKRKTMYVVMDCSRIDNPAAVFTRKKNAQEYADRISWPRIKKIRFRTPE